MFQDKIKNKNGYTEAELLDLARDNSGVEAEKIPYAVAEYYGFGKFIRKYGYYPSFFPLYISCLHGIYSRNVPQPVDIEMRAKYHFVNSRRFKDYYDGIHHDNVYILFSPYVFYRRSNRINIVENPKGTLAFPAHSSLEADYQDYIPRYIEDLKKLPEEFQPVDICLHYLDILRGRHKPYMENGFRVYTAGNVFNRYFVERFYSILRNYKYSTSNDFGTAMFYSEEMGMSHFVYGNRTTYYAIDERQEAEKDGSLKKGEFGRMISNMFEYPDLRKTPEKKHYIEQELGINDGIGRLHMSLILYKSLFTGSLKRMRQGFVYLFWILFYRHFKKYYKRFIKE